MIYLYMAEKVTDTDYIINGIHNFPFDEVHGLGKSADELKTKGYLVEELPIPRQEHGKVPVLHINPNTLEVWYMYEDRPLIQEEELAKVRAENEILTESLIDFKTQYMAVPCQNHQDYPVVIDKIIEEAKKDGTV